MRCCTMPHHFPCDIAAQASHGLSQVIHYEPTSREVSHLAVCRKSGQMASRSPDSRLFPAPLSATRLPIFPCISFQFWSECINPAPLACVSRTGKSIGTNDRHMSFDVFESKKRQIFRDFAQILHAWRGGLTDILPNNCISVLFVNMM